MAELDVGRHCQLEQCRQRDFLPFVCDGCSGVFCLEHRSRESHSCPEVTVIERLKSDTHTSYPCSFKDCAERELVPVMCPYCEKNFCLRHRHQSDHECEELEIPKSRMAATQKLVKDIIDSKTGETASKRRKGAKNSETAAKVALMKLKMHANGDKSLPQVCGPLTVVASSVAEHRLQTRRLSGHGSRAQPLCGMWDLPEPGHKPVSPASAGRLSTTVTPGKPDW
ncbi:AN1-type zinc finger protein 1 isoform X3 [Physeter macrocephalus]|uniref:AN1-type zinc finger protein 1 isoform X3 n=1 Tax=Physeter macrocephalus TaxID=9755 RepID=A0A9W2X6I3_PHYMC|nr:AN1-type zinc finger protein 1 isoform X3 [Physeter catodon]